MSHWSVRGVKRQAAISLSSSGSHTGTHTHTAASSTPPLSSARRQRGPSSAVAPLTIDCRARRVSKLHSFSRLASKGPLLKVSPSHFPHAAARLLRATSSFASRLRATSSATSANCRAAKDLRARASSTPLCVVQPARVQSAPLPVSLCLPPSVRLHGVDRSLRLDWRCASQCGNGRVAGRPWAPTARRPTTR